MSKILALVLVCLVACGGQPADESPADAGADADAKTVAPKAPRAEVEGGPCSQCTAHKIGDGPDPKLEILTCSSGEYYVCPATCDPCKAALVAAVGPLIECCYP